MATLQLSQYGNYQTTLLNSEKAQKLEILLSQIDTTKVRQKDKF